MEWNPELNKIQANISRRKKADKAIDAAVLTPGTMIVGEGAGSLAAQAIPTGLSKETVQPMSKAKKKMLNKAMQYHKMDQNIKVVTGRKALKSVTGMVPNAQAKVNQGKLIERLNKPKSKVKYLFDQKINLPQGGNIEAAMHELGHLKHHQRPIRHVISSSTGTIGKPVGAALAVAGMMHEDTAKYVPVVAPAIAYGSLVGTEAGANAFAIKEMTRQKGFRAGLKTIKKVAPYMATYLAAPLAVGGALYGLKKKIHG